MKSKGFASFTNAEKDEQEQSLSIVGFLDVFLQRSHNAASGARHCTKQLGIPSFHFNFYLSKRFFGYKFALYPASGVADLTAVDAAVSAMELQVKAIKDRLREEALAIPKTKARSSHALYLFVFE